MSDITQKLVFNNNILHILEYTTNNINLHKSHIMLDSLMCHCSPADMLK